jgi:response regulator NasT
LPGVTGLEIAKSLQPHAVFPIIFLSAYGDDSIVNTAIELGAMAYIVKPVDPSRLVPTLRTVMRRFAELMALRGESAQLSSALQTTRATSIVVGLLMERLKLSEKQAYDRLRLYCRSQNRKVTEVAADILAVADKLNSAIASIAAPVPAPAPAAKAR